MDRAATRLVRPAADHLAEYRDALRRGWSPDNVRTTHTAREHLAAIDEDAAAFLAAHDDPDAKLGPIELPDGSRVARLPSFKRWIWADGLCGAIGFRWQPGTTALPPTALGHVGYAVVPWRRREGHATRALGLLLAEIAPLGLPWVELTTEPGNAASVAVIRANGGVLVEHFTTGPEYGTRPGLRFRIDLHGPAE